MKKISPSSVRIMSWFISAALFSIALAGLFLNSHREIKVHEQLNVEYGGSVLGGSDSTPVTSKNSASFVGSVYAFHRLLDSQIEEEKYSKALELAKELPASSQRNLAIQAILEDVRKLTDSKIEMLESILYNEETPTESDSAVSENNPDVEEMLKLGDGLINLLPNNEHKSAFLSRYGQLRYQAEALDLISNEWAEVPSSDASLELAEKIAIETFTEEVNNNPSDSNTFFMSMGLATNKVIKFLFLALVAGFVGAIGEQYASHAKLKSILKTASDVVVKK